MTSRDKRRGGAGARERRRAPLLRPAVARLFLLTLFLLPPLAAANAAQAGGGHILYGDFRIEEARAAEGGAAAEPEPATFHILLYTSAGQLVSRQPVTNNGRYRFLDVPNGEYDLVVELENAELARVRVQLAYSYRTDHRQDILMESRPARDAGGAGASGTKTVSAAELYRRPAESDALFKKAARAVEGGKYEEAIALLRRVVAADPGDFVAWSQLGTLLSARREHEEAERAYARSLAARPDYVTALVNLGRLRMARKNFDGAIEVLSRAVEAQPRSAAAHYLLGESLLQVKKGSRAVVHLNEAIRLDPVGRAEAHLRLALLYNAAGLKERAAAEYEQYLAKNPGHPDRKRFEQYIAENKKR